MTAYIKVGGSWAPSTGQYVKVGGVWQPASTVYTKVGGAWSTSTVGGGSGGGSPTPPAAPVLNVSMNSTGRYLDVSTKLASHNADLDIIRVLVRTDTYPTHPDAQGFVSSIANNWSGEPWSDWDFTGSSAHPDDTVADTKFYPVNPTSSTVLPGNTYYYFAAWSRNKSGTWSAGTTARIWMPPQVQVPKTAQLVKTYKAVQSRSFQGSGALRSNAADYLLYQGWASAYGNQKSVVWFPDITIRRDLADAITIDKVELYLKAVNWENISGGFARVAFTNLARDTTTYNLNSGSNWNFFGNFFFVSNFAEWINVTDDARHFWQSGRTGIVLGPGADTGNKWHGTFRDHTAIAAPQLRITYTVKV